MVCIYLHHLIQVKPQQWFKIVNIKEFVDTEKQVTFPYNMSVYVSAA